MAKAERKNVTPPPPPPPEDVIVLTMNVKEAQTLTAILGCVSGSPEYSPRMHADAIAEALFGAGVQWLDTDEHKLKSGNIIFWDYSDL